GAEVRGFTLQQSSPSLRLGSNFSGSPILGLPFVDAASGTEAVDYVSFPGRFEGFVHVASASTLWGIEANFPTNCLKTSLTRPGCPGPWVDLRVDALAGFAYLDLDESLTVQAASQLLQNGGTNFNGAIILPPAGILTQDNFGTRSQFYGGQVGLRTELCHDCFVLELLTLLR